MPILCQPCISELPFVRLNILNPTVILQSGCEYFGVDIERVKSKSRVREITIPRHIILYAIMKYNPTFGLKRAGELVGRRDHATVLHSLRVVDNLSFSEPQFKRTVSDFEKYLKKIDEKIS